MNEHAEIARLQKRGASYRGKIGHLSKQIKKLRQDLAAYKDTADLANEVIGKLADRRDTLENKLRTANARVRSLEDKMAGRRKVFAQYMKDKAEELRLAKIQRDCMNDAAEDLRLQLVKLKQAKLNSDRAATILLAVAAVLLVVVCAI